MFIKISMIYFFFLRPLLSREKAATNLSSTFVAFEVPAFVLTALFLRISSICSRRVNIFFLALLEIIFLTSSSMLIVIEGILFSLGLVEFKLPKISYQKEQSHEEIYYCPHSVCHNNISYSCYQKDDCSY